MAWLYLLGRTGEDLATTLGRDRTGHLTRAGGWLASTLWVVGRKGRRISRRRGPANHASLEGKVMLR